MKKTKTKPTKIQVYTLAIVACFLSLTVVMSSAHAKDIVKDTSRDVGMTSRTVDPVAKAIGDLHNHIDKQTLKSISMDNPVSARQREIKALNEARHERGAIEIIEEFVAFYRLSFAMRLSLAIA